MILKAKPEIVTFQELLSLGFNKRWLKYAVKTLLNEKLLFKIKKGVYSTTPLETLDKFKLATTMFKGYLGLDTAAYIHNWIDEYPYTIYVLTKNVSKNIKISDTEFKAIAIKQRFTGSTMFKDYIVSTKAKTLFDLLWFENLFPNERLKTIFKNAKLSRNEKAEFLKYYELFKNARIESKVQTIAKQWRCLSWILKN